MARTNPSKKRLVVARYAAVAFERLLGLNLKYPIARAFTDYRVSRVVGGANEVMRELIARKL